MKSIQRLVMIGFLWFFSAIALAEQPIVNIYNWSNYISSDVLKRFTKETGIQVNYTTYDSNETMYAKLKANPKSGYDIVVPSTYFVDRMRKQGMLQRLDKKKLSHFNNLNPSLLNKAYDPDNQYSVPYFWSTTGVVLNSRYHKASTLKKWLDLWQPQYRDQLLLLDDVREVFSMALLALGYSPNERNPLHIRQAYKKLQQLWPNIRLFSADGVKSLYIDEDVTVGMAWNGDSYQAVQANPYLTFIYPAEGFVVSIDSMAIPSGAEHPENAYRFINFILRAEIAAKISLTTGYASPNQAARKFIPNAILNNPLIYPNAKLLQRSVVQTDVGEAAAYYHRYWELLKIGT